MTNRCYKCGGRKQDMFIVVFRKLGIYARHKVKVGYSRYYCSDCLKEKDMYEEVKQE